MVNKKYMAFVMFGQEICSHYLDGIPKIMELHAYMKQKNNKNKDIELVQQYSIC